jgi:hypothetical protein
MQLNPWVNMLSSYINGHNNESNWSHNFITACNCKHVTDGCHYIIIVVYFWGKKYNLSTESMLNLWDIISKFCTVTIYVTHDL